MSDRLIPLGKLVTTHGLEGWLKLKTYNFQSHLLGSGRQIVLDNGGIQTPHILESSKAHKGNLLVKLRGTNEINFAKTWVGSTLLVAEDDLEPPQPGEFYYYQAVGLEVFTTQGERIGKVTRIWIKEGGDLYVVTDASKEYLVPAVKEVIEKIDLPAGKMIINLPEGLLEV